MRRTLPILVTTLMLTGALAGCLGSQPSPGSAETDDADEEFLEEHGINTTTPEEPATADSWYALTLDADANGNVVAFNLTIPEDAEVKDEDHWGAVWLEVAPVLSEEGEDALTDWAFLAFDDTDELEYSGLFSSTYETIQRQAPGIQSRSEHPVQTEPAGIYVDAEPGQTIPIVVAARANASVDFGVAFRYMDEYPEDASGDVSEDLDEFLEDRDGPARVPVDTVRRDGLGFGLYVEIDFPGLSFTVRNPGIEVTNDHVLDPRPIADVRDITVSYNFSSDRGWGLGMGLWIPLSSADASRWDVEADVHGHDFQASWGPGYLGSPWIYLFTGDGPGGSKANVDLQTGSAAGNVLVVQHLDLGGTLKELTGETSPELEFTYPAQESQVEATDDALRIQTERGTLTNLGPWSPVEDEI